MDRELPSWLDESFLASALGGSDQESGVEVLKFSACSAVPPGNNYLSHLYRVRVDYKTSHHEKESISLMVKAPLTKGITCEMIREMNIYVKELNAYKQVLPLFKNISSFEFGPKTYHSSVKDALVLKDMNEDGYIMCDKFKQLDFPHCEAVMKLIAKFHASSVACYRDHKVLIESIGEEGFYKLGDKFEKETKPWIECSVNMTADKASKMEGLQSMTDLLRSRANKVAETAVELTKPRTSGLNVLNHGDLWINNILFKYNDDGDIIDIKFIDFQVCRYTSPVMDLLYFLWSSSNADVRANKIHVLLEIYRNNLNWYLEDLACKERLSAEELRANLVAADDWVIITICNLLPFILCQSADAINMEDIREEDISTDKLDDRFVKLFNGKYFVEALPAILAHFQAWRLSR